MNRTTSVGGSAPRVVRRLRTGKAVLYSALLGTCMGALGGLAWGMLKDFVFLGMLWNSWGMSLLVTTVRYGPILILWTIGLVVFSRRCHRLGCAFAVGFAFGATYAYASLSYGWFGIYASGGRAEMMIRVGFELFLSALSGAMAGLVATCAMVCARQVVRGVVEQDGTLCWHCGYAIRELPRCPECGDPRRDHPTGAGRRPQWRRAVLATFVCMVLAMPAAYHVVWHAYPRTGAFAELRLYRGGMWCQPLSPTGPQTFQFKEANAVVVPIADSTETAILYLTCTRPATDQPPGQLQLVVPDPTHAWSYGEPTVVCNLSAVEVAQVNERGVPETLVEAMIAAAKQGGWVPRLLARHRPVLTLHLASGWAKRRSV